MPLDPELSLPAPWLQILAYEETSEAEGQDEGGAKVEGKETDGVADAAAAAAAELKGSKAD